LLTGMPSRYLWSHVLPFVHSTVPYIPTPSNHTPMQLLVVALVLSRLDYCNSLLINLPASLIHRLQSVQNAAARLIFNMRRSEHITDALISVHWLRVPERIVFKVATLTFRALHGTVPPYITSQFTRVADMSNRQRLRSASLISSTFRPSACQLSVVAPFRLPVLRSGTAYQMTSPPLCPCQPSGTIWRHTYSAAVTTLTDTACTHSGYSGPRGGVAA